jgi:hypothetical protein
MFFNLLGCSARPPGAVRRSDLRQALRLKDRSRFALTAGRTPAVPVKTWPPTLSRGGHKKIVAAGNYFSFKLRAIMSV